MAGALHINAVGDISFGDYPFCPGFGTRSLLSREKRNPFETVKEKLSSADIVFGNLETVLSDAGLDPNNIHSWEMRGRPEFVSHLADAGFNIMNIANNHIMQHGNCAFNDTVQLLASNGIQAVGEAKDYRNGCKPVIVRARGFRVGFLGYAFEKDIYADPPAYAQGDPACIAGDIQSIRPQVDILIVSCHWGLEFIPRPSRTTIHTGRFLIDSGADLVLGHHPHVIQGYEYYKEKLIVYSMGNFLFDMLWDESFRKSAIYSFTIKESGKVTLEMTPVYINDSYHTVFMRNRDFPRMRTLNEAIHVCDKSDVEKMNLLYYMDYEKRRKMNRLKSYYHFLRHIHLMDKQLVYQILKRSVHNKIPFKINRYTGRG